jgi:hypothetical protein
MIFGLSFATCVLLAADARGQATEEYRVKAAFLYNLTKFVGWPAQVIKGSRAPIEICILGKDPFGSALAEAVNDKAIEGRPFSIRQIADVQQAASCQILFVSASERKRLRPILDVVRDGPVLTVGDTDGFASEGGIVNFKIEAGRVRLQINMVAAERARIGISSKLLSLAEIVKK